ncbi:hypothetical protein U876_08860 [Aeromonas hydrophila NJ-35]|uniref:hypothetical protein n=1 Tax=Aeromonas hydrophila TaxID=644 RepID=UPI000640A176|nr:hypothetical protein [Aeromonas hydrophila]AKJ37019.1 hypothetical protein U876_08860 [Aeromonas hydrophila NJ-35]HDK8695927.1 hypothetical protein [Aeromonas hydrophila]
MTIKHTPEPWHECAEGKCGCGQILGPESVYIATVKDPATRRRIVACVNACRGLPTDELEQKGLVAAVGTQLLAADDRAEGQEREIRKLARTTADAENKLADALDQCDELLAVLKKLSGDVEELMKESGGVYGLHQNGEPAPWAELVAGGRHETWLLSLSDAAELIAKLKAGAA